MRLTLNIAFVLLAISCISQRDKAESRQIDVELNYNIHTQLILEHFAWPGKYPTRPMIVASAEHFDKFKDHPAVLFSDSLLRNEVFYSDELMEVLLYSELLPKTGYKYSLKNTPYENRIDLIDKWKEKVAEFYIDADVKGFLESNKEFYDGAIDEIVINLPSNDFIDQMESFYKDKKLKYTIIPAPEMQTGDQRGVGPYVRTKDGMLVYQIISASQPIDELSRLSDYQQFGFNDRNYILTNARHEFGHAFVNPLLEKVVITELINKYEGLFTPKLRNVMENQNYGTWWDCVAEHFVRLGEIRIAERSGDISLSANLRLEYTDNKKFIFLPELEQRIKEYESNTKYQTFDNYLPDLIKTFDSFSAQEVDKRLEKN